MNIDILGTNYNVTVLLERDKCMLENNADGYTDFNKKEIKVLTCDAYNQILRHELVHAYLFEVGMAFGYGIHNEDNVDFIAMIFPKLNKIFKEANCEGD